MSDQLVAADPHTLSVARMLIEAGWLSTPADVGDFFAKPHKYQPQADLWFAAGTPWPDEAGWDLYLRRMETTA